MEPHPNPLLRKERENSPPFQGGDKGEVDKRQGWGG